MADAIESILGQPKVRAYLRSSLKSGRISHAYLFVGPAGSNKTQAAYALAQALLCEQKASVLGGCTTCDTCRRIARKKHPDVRYCAPQGASGYLVEQIREIVSDTSLAPIQAEKKIYILDRVDRMNAAAANAFLKTLEEPARDVVLILLARTCESVLPTILSRCQVIPFRHIPATESARILVQNTGVSLDAARAAIQACDGSLDRAAEFLKSSERCSLRKNVLESMSRLRLADDWDLIEQVHELADEMKVPLDAVRAEQEQEIAEYADFFEKSAIRQIEMRNKRALSAKTTELTHQMLACVRGWLRDVMASCAGTPELIINVDVRESVTEAALYTTEAKAAAALLCVDDCEAAMAYNVSPETCLDVLLLEVKEKLFEK